MENKIESEENSFFYEFIRCVYTYEWKKAYVYNLNIHNFFV